MRKFFTLIFMKKIFLLMLVWTAWTLQAKEYTYQTVEGDPMQARIYTLDNGLTVYLSQNKTKPEIQTFIAVRAGSQNDPLESTGLAHYQEHIMFKGTKQYGTTDYEKELPNLLAIDSLYELYGQTTDAERRKAIYHEIDSVSYESSKIAIASEFDKLMSGIGATGVNAFTSTNMTCYFEVIPSGELTRWAMIESDRFQNLVIRGFHTELETVYEEFNMYATQDADKVQLAINQILFSDIPYRQHTILGTQEDLKNPSLKNIRNFYDTYYRPNNVAVCLAGDLDFDYTIAVIDAWFGSWQSKEIPAPVHYDQADLKVHKDTIVYGKEAPEVCLAWKLPNIRHEDMDALEMMDFVLANEKCGLLDVDIDQKQLMLSSYVSLDADGDYSTYFIGGSPKQGQSLEQVRQLLLAEVEKLKNGDFDEEMLQSIIRNQKRYKLQALQTNYSRVWKFIWAHIYQIPYADIVHDLDRRALVTKDDIIRVANKYLNDNYACVFKEQKEDANPPKLDKPHITPIEMNRESTSAFYKQIMTIPSVPTQPQFLDFNKDLSRSVLSNGVELLYCQNKENDLSELRFIINKGTDQDPALDFASEILSYLGTATMTVDEYKNAIYNEAAEAPIGTGWYETFFQVYGLKESLPAALALMEDHVLTAKADDEVLDEIISDRIKAHNDAKSDQASCFNQLCHYGMMGKEVTAQRNLTPKQMKAYKAEECLNHLRSIIPAIERVIYYGPLSEEEVKQMLSSSRFFAQVDKDQRNPYKRFEIEEVNQPEVLLAPYKANNVYIAAYANWGEVYNPKDRAIISLFNEYLDGSMGGIVFQEMREARALCYSSWAEYSTPSFKGEKNYFTFGVMSQNDKLKECISTFDSICNSMPISQEAFDNAKKSLIKWIERRRFVRASPIYSYISFTDLGWDHDIYEDVYKEIQALTLDDVVKFQQEHVANRMYRFMVLGDSKDLDIKFLKSIGKVKKLTLNSIFIY